MARLLLNLRHSGGDGDRVYHVALYGVYYGGIDRPSRLLEDREPAAKDKYSACVRLGQGRGKS